MKIVMAGNMLSIHMLPLCQALESIAGVEFKYIATKPQSPERLQMGFLDLNHAYRFALCAYDGSEERKRAVQLCEECDLLLAFGAPASYVKQALAVGKPVLFHSERLFKASDKKTKNLARMIKWKVLAPKYGGKRKNAFLLCASAYAAEDYAKTGNFIGRAYKWGYFPECRRYEPDTLMAKKAHGVPRLLWVGRMIGLKHPEAAIETARRLKAEGKAFRLDMIGEGQMQGCLREMIIASNLQDSVNMPGAMPPEQVREYMERADIFLFTSDRGEGWGAVLNESMNSGCAVVAADQIGAVPYLMKDGENGLIFRSGDWNDLYEKVKRLLDDRAFRERLGHAAYRTMAETWNAEAATERLLRLADCLRRGEDTPFADGPCSRA